MRPLRSALPGLAAATGYLAAAVALSWPLARDFATWPIGDVHYDSRHAIWVMWYTVRAFAGAVPWPYTTDLLHPHGISLLVDGVGPFNALLSLPFWPWGPAAAFNGTALTGLTLSGLCLYALARHLEVPRGPSFVAGLLYLAWPVHLIALFGHLEKLFVGLLPLTLLAGLVAFDWRRSAWRTLLPGLALLAALLQNGNQFVFAGLGLAAVAVTRLARAHSGDRSPLLRRITLTAIVALLVCAPLLAAIVQTMRNPAMAISLGSRSAYYSPDLLHLVVPAPHQAIGTALYPRPRPLPEREHTWTPAWTALQGTRDWYGTGLETAVAIPLVALALGAAAWRRAGTSGRDWLIFGGIFSLLALGPWLRVAGTATWIPLPYAGLATIPGLDVMRTPGRFMLLASVGLALAAGMGCTALAGRGNRRRHAVVAVACLLAVIELWPRPWPQSALPPTSPFHARLAQEAGDFAILDLPHGWHSYSDRASAYMLFQLTHRKPIAWSYLSRYYARFPNQGLDGLWHVEVRDSPRIRARLRELGYRYVIWHKRRELFEGGRVADGFTGVPRGPGRPATEDGFMREAFAGEPPVYDDALVTVFRVDAGTGQ